jgi:membrane protease YdiL (CAAX protease family)
MVILQSPFSGQRTLPSDQGKSGEYRIVNRLSMEYYWWMQLPPDGFKLTAISYLTLLLLAVLWPLSSLVLLGSQADLLKEVSEPVNEIYYPTMVVQLITILLVFVAVRTEKVNLDDLGMRGFNRWTVLQAVAFVIAANVVLSALQLALFAQSPGSFNEITGIIPHTTYERLVWVILCAIVAVSEEIAFRGYILTRVTRLARGRVWVGTLVATLAFASGHLYQGFGGLVIIGIYGLMFAGLYLYTGSLYPGIIAHFLQDATILLLPGSAK